MPGGAYGNCGIVKGGALNEFLFCPLFFSTKEKWTYIMEL